MKKQEVFLSFSGGLDSTTLLCWCLHENLQVHPVFFNYGSKHGPFEFAAAEAVLQAVLPHTPLTVIHLNRTGIFDGNGSALLAANSGKEIPEGTYNTGGSLDATVVPGRNFIMASILASMAEAHVRRQEPNPVVDEAMPAPLVALGVHAGDHALYPDCRPEFVDALDKAIQLSSDGTVSVYAPFVFKTKAEIVRLAMEINAPLELTRSCYKQQAVACGKCGTCQERLAAFAANGLVDPISYAAI